MGKDLLLITDRTAAGALLWPRISPSPLPFLAALRSPTSSMIAGGGKKTSRCRCSGKKDKYVRYPAGMFIVFSSRPLLCTGIFIKHRR